MRSLLDRSFGHASSVKTRKAAPQLIASARPAARTKPVSVAKAEPAPSPRAPVQVAAAAPKPQPKPLTSKTVEPAPSAAKVADASPSIPKIIEPVPKTIEEAAALKTIDDEGQTPAAPIAASGPVVVAQVDLPRTTDVTAVAEAPTIDIAKVRRVMVAPRVKSAVPTPEPVEERSTDVAPAPAQPAFVTASAGSAPKVDFRSDRQGAAVAPVAAPSPQAQPLADETVVAKAATAATPAAARQPSTFEAQMAALAVKLNFPTAPEQRHAAASCGSGRRSAAARLPAQGSRSDHGGCRRSHDSARRPGCFSATRSRLYRGCSCRSGEGSSPRGPRCRRQRRVPDPDRRIRFTGRGHQSDLRRAPKRSATAQWPRGRHPPDR